MKGFRGLMAAAVLRTAVIGHRCAESAAVRSRPAFPAPAATCTGGAGLGEA